MEETVQTKYEWLRKLDAVCDLFIGLIGSGGMGRGDLDTFFLNPEVDCPIVCDVDDAQIERAVKLVEEKRKHKPDTVKDFRRVIDRKDVDVVLASVRAVNPTATVIKANSPVSVDKPDQVKGKRVLVVEDGPTLTHGEMRYGAGHVAARKFGAAQIVDPRPAAVGSFRDTFAKYTHVTDVLPAMGYGQKQIDELQQTINAVDCDLVLIGTPIALGRMLSGDMRVPVVLNTAYGVYKNNFMSWAADAYIVKSADLTELKRTVHELLGTGGSAR